jgi:hypothetical protein
MAGFNVVAQGQIVPYNPLLVVVNVIDSAGNPVTGLTQSNFYVYQCLPEEDRLMTASRWDDFLPGIYKLFFKEWDPGQVTGTFVFYVRVHQDVVVSEFPRIIETKEGGALTSGVKVDSLG